MAKSLAQLRKQKGSMLESLKEDVKKQGKKDYSDERFWRPSRNSEGSVFATVRFLPPPLDGDWGEEEHAFVVYYKHGFQGPRGHWYIENSLTSIGKDDPVTEYNNMLWQDIGTKESKDQARTQKRKKRFVSNVLVIKDPVNPENEGKVFLYEYGQKIFDKIKSYLTPPKESGREALNIFDPVDGANFHIEAHRTQGDGNYYLDYGSSKFDVPAPLFKGDEDKIVEAWEQAHSLNQFVDETNEDWYKPYDELRDQLVKRMGAESFEQLLDPAYFSSGATKNPMEELEKDQNDLSKFLDDDDEEDDIPDFASKSKAKKTKEAQKSDDTPEVSDEDIDDLQDLADLDGLDDI